MTVTHTALANLYDDAADYHETHGWTRGWFGLHGFPRCIEGGMVSGLTEEGRCVLTPEEGALYIQARRVLADFLGYTEAWVWNDTVCKSAQQAIDALRAAAKALRVRADAEGEE